MKLPVGIALIVIALMVAIYAYFAINKKPLGPADMLVVALICVGLVLLGRWLFSRSRKERKV